MQGIRAPGGVLATIAAIATLTAGGATGAPADHTYRLAIAAGDSGERDVRLERLTLATAWSGASVLEAGLWDSLLWELNATRWNPQGGGAREVTYSLGVRASLRHPLGGSGRTFVEAGVGPMWIESPRLREDFDLGDNVLFNPHIGIGRVLGPARTHELAASVHHASNGDLEGVNPGIDFFLIEYSVLF